MRSVLLYALWLVAAAGIAVIVAGFFGVTMGFVGLDQGAIVFNVLAPTIFVVLAALPFLVRPHRV